LEIFFSSFILILYFNIILLLLTRRLLNYKKKKKKILKNEFNPFVRGSVLRSTVTTPKKPNSARRPIAKILLVNKNLLLSHIPGIGHNLRKHSLVLVRTGGARDLPMVNFSCIRGVYDLIGVVNRITRRSLYGVKKNKLMQKKKFCRI
jgi:small subunit ribosomal protein S12